ncbi:MAG: hypothetical protein ABH827_01350 [bacterium]
MQTKKRILIALTCALIIGTTQNTYSMLKPFTHDYLPLKLIDQFLKLKSKKQEIHPGYCDLERSIIFSAQRGKLELLKKQTTNLTRLGLESLCRARLSYKLEDQIKKFLDLCIEEKIKYTDYSPKTDKIGYTLIFLTQTKQDDLIKHVLNKNFEQIKTDYLIKAIYIAAMNNQESTFDVFVNFLLEKQEEFYI